MVARVLERRPGGAQGPDARARPVEQLAAVQQLPHEALRGRVALARDVADPRPRAPAGDLDDLRRGQRPAVELHDR